MIDEAKLKRLVLMAIESFDNMDGLDSQMIRERIREIAPIVKVADEETLEAAAKVVETRLSVWLNLGDVIEGEEPHDPHWYKRMEESDWKYWHDYQDHLALDQELSPRVVSALGDETLRTLGLLADPAITGPWSRKGMVIGNVQSGKTANYLGLVSRAADCGYKVIIIIAGIHNNLRSQTQKRTDEGFVGRKSSNPSELIGVGSRNQSRNHPVAFTTNHSDFAFASANNVIGSIGSISSPMVFVIKKNGKVLERLHRWLKDLNVNRHTGQIMEYPLLIIDDEADNASINTSEEELNPSKINAHIRSILSLFSKNCYVGYTATPFANIFINPESTAEAIKSDLFPKDFIHCLDAPSNYSGAERIFGGGDLKTSLVELDDIEKIIPPKHKKDIPVTDLPDSLREALGTFVLARAIRLSRNQHKHCSMLVNVSPYQPVQKQVRDLLVHELTQLKDAIWASSKLDPKEGLKQPVLATLKEIFEDRYGNIELAWEDIAPYLHDSAKEISVKVINSQSSDSLDYQAYEDREERLSVVAVGGYALSRGLTLEGLMVSYISRNTKLYDTLMQMGRWFGYRPGYEDICRIWMRSEMQRWYGHITKALEELRQQVKQMSRDGRTPREFALYVQTSQDQLLITAANKMRHTTSYIVETDYSGMLKESDVVSTETSVTELNRNAIIKLHEQLEAWGNKTTPDDSKNNWRGSDVWREVPSEIVADFIGAFKSHSHFSTRKALVLNYFRKSFDAYPLCDVVFVKLADTSRQDKSIPYLSRQERTAGSDRKLEGAKDAGWSIGGNYRVAGTGDERIGLLKAEFDKAQTDKGEREKAGDADFRKARNRPLLMIHLIDLKKEETKEAIENGSGIPAFSLSFPGGRKFQRPIKYVFNETIAREQLDWLSNQIDDSDEEVDFDRETTPLA